MAELTPEPPNGSMVLVDDPQDGKVLARDDSLGSDDQRWHLVGDNLAPPLSWSQVIGIDLDRGQLLGVDRSQITRLYTEDELREAVAAVQLRVVGEHIIEAAGYCRTHGVTHSPEEIARAEDREDSCG